MTALEQSFADLAAKNGLRVVNVGISLTSPASHRFSAVVHWEGYSRDGNPCAMGNGPDTATALAKAIEQSRIDRTPNAADIGDLADEPIQIGEAA